MRIALLSTCAVSVPPRAYGGSELVVAELAKMLTRLGHEVVVFASGDSTPAAELRAHFAEPVWPPNDMAELRHSAFAWRSVSLENPPFDVVHAHQAPAISFSAVCSTPTVLTLHHHRVDELIDFYLDFPDVTHVAISHRQAQLVPELGVRHVVHHGLDVDLYEAGNGAGNWLAFVGRFAPEKAPHLAIDAALEVGIPLRLGGQPHWNNDEYFAREVLPRLRRAGSLVRWDGEVPFKPKLEIMGGARATLFPIQWEEPFGLVMIESMLVGTPVIAFAAGAAPEVVEDGVTGFLVRNSSEMAERIRQLGAIDRKKCRQRARERWSSLRMAREYEHVYADAARQHRRARAHVRSGVDAHEIRLAASRR
jgi:glycosyltransferase involved in cell wall biosynthesis